jgi:hypothetical protein
MDRRELDWASGLFEGEGCISLASDSSRTRTKWVTLSLSMTDEAPVRRFHAAVAGLGYVRTVKRNLPNGQAYEKTVWLWQTGRFEHVQAVIALLWFGLGPRRRAKATEALSMVAAAGSTFLRGQRFMVCSHEGCTKPASTRGLCRKHYMAQWREHGRQAILGAGT